MKVALFLGGFTPDAGGGYTFQADIFLAFAKVMREAAHRFIVLCDSQEIADFVFASSGCEVVRVAPYSGLERIRSVLIREVPFFRRILRNSGRIERAATSAEVDLVWFVGGGSYEAMDVPYIATVWDLQHRSHPWFPEVSAGGTWKAREEGLGPFLQRSICVITGTEVGKKEIHSMFQVPLDRIRIFPHPTPSFALLESGNRLEKLSAELGLTAPFLLYPAQFWAHKNHANLLIALAALRDSYGIKMSLALVGSDKGNQAFVRQLADSLGLFDRVFFLGFVKQNDLVALYRNALSIVYPSFCGPENLPPLEAFALGCPVIAADIPGAREQLGDAALLAAPDDPNDLAEKIRLVAENRELCASLIKRGLARAFSWTAEDYAQGVLTVINKFEAVRRTWR